MNDLKENLWNNYPFRIELHAHTSPVSGCSQLPADELVRRCHKAGANGVVITNHATPNGRNTPQLEWAEQYLADYRLAYEEGQRLGVKVYLGIEIRFPDNNNDYLVYGVNESFAITAWNYLDSDLHSFYTACKAEDRLIVQAHPFRDGMSLADTADLDGIEVFNAHPNHNSRVSLAAQYHREVGGVITAGTDLHHPGHEGQVFACFKELPEDSFALAKALKAGEYIFTMGNSVILP